MESGILSGMIADAMRKGRGPALKNEFADLWHRWLPPVAVRALWEGRLREFYEANASYDEMTRAPGKAEHPQAKLLGCLVTAGGVYVEVGCGGGEICRLVGRTAQVTGVDVSPLALAAAEARDDRPNKSYVRAEAEHLPFESGTCDGVYSFEVLEHLWDPVAALREMARILKPGGFLLVSMPNRFSLDLHVPKGVVVRMIEFALAAIRFGVDRWRGTLHHNLIPDLEGTPYPDCDMISSIAPGAWPRVLRDAGCDMVFNDSTFMCAQRSGFKGTIGFQKNTARLFLKHFGDHMLVLARKTIPACVNR